MRSFYFVLALCFLYIVLSSRSSGAAATLNRDRTGSPIADGNTCALSGCHNGNSFSPEVTVELLEDGEPVMEYIQGQSYKLRVSVEDSGASGYGFQAVAMDASEAQAGTFANAPTGFKITELNGLSYPEHGSRRPDSSFEIDWVAPEEGTGEVRFFSAVAAVNSNGAPSGDGTAAALLTVTENEIVSTTDERALAAEVNIFPNPTADFAVLTVRLAEAKTLTMRVFNGKGQIFSEEARDLPQGETTLPINVSDLTSGQYYLLLDDGVNQAVKALIRL